MSVGLVGRHPSSVRVLSLVAGMSAASNLPARFAGDLLVSVFITAFTRWIAPDETRDLPDLQREGLAVFREFAADRGPAARCTP